MAKATKKKNTTRKKKSKEPLLDVELFVYADLIFGRVLRQPAGSINLKATETVDGMSYAPSVIAPSPGNNCNVIEQSGSQLRVLASDLQTGWGQAFRRRYESAEKAQKVARAFRELIDQYNASGGDPTTILKSVKPIRF